MRSARDWKSTEASEVTAAATFDGRRFERMFEDIERRNREMGSALGKYARDPGRMKPQLQNLKEAANSIATDVRVILRLVDQLEGGQ